MSVGSQSTIGSLADKAGLVQTKPVSQPEMPTGFLHSLPWDGTWLLSGLWLCPLLLLLDHLGQVESFFLLGTLCFWLTHRFSSLFLAFTSPHYAPVRQQQPLRFVGVPLLVTGLTLAWLALPWSSWTLTERVLCLAGLDYAWALYHFAIQHYGVLRLYGLRQNVGKEQAMREKRWCLVLGGVLPWWGEWQYGMTWLQQEGLFSAPWALLPESANPYFALGTGGLSLMAWLHLQPGRQSRAYQLYLFSLLLLANSVWWLSPLVFLVLLSLQHWLVAIGVATLAHVVPYKRTQNSAAWRKVLLWGGLTVGLVPWLSLDSPDVSVNIWLEAFPRIQSWLQQEHWLVFFLAFSFASGFVHYLLDRAVYRFSDPCLRQHTQALFVSQDRV